MFAQYEKLMKSRQTPVGKEKVLTKRQLRSPNAYRAMMGLMDLSYRELADSISAMRGGGCDPSELCRALRGVEGEEYDKLRGDVALAFGKWLGEVLSSRNGQRQKIRKYGRAGKEMSE